MGNGAVKPSSSSGAANSDSTPPLGWKIVTNEHRVLICRFCGGATCKREDYTKQKGPAAIVGLHSTWLTEQLVAMQRPSSRLIVKHNLIDQFRQNNIRAIINLQSAGEHPLCGDGIHPEGFSYRPDEFAAHGISHYNFAFTDMSVPSMAKMLSIVQVMNFHIRQQNQKVAVHCHAGYGRTGIVCACWFIYSLGLGAQEAIDAVRSRRPGSVQTKKQKEFVIAFEAHLRAIRCVFVLHNTPSFIPSVDPTAVDCDEPSMSPSFSSAIVTNATPPAETPFSYTQPYTLEVALSRQRSYLSGADARTYRNVPKVVAFVCDKLIAHTTSSSAALAALLPVPSRSNTTAILSLSPIPSLPVLPPLPMAAAAVAASTTTIAITNRDATPAAVHHSAASLSLTSPHAAVPVPALTVTTTPIAATPVQLPALPTAATATSAGVPRSATHHYSASLSLSTPMAAAIHTDLPVVPVVAAPPITPIPPTMTMTSINTNLAMSAASLVATAIVDVEPWDHASEDALTRIKRRLNNDDWAELERCDLRLLTMLLCDWIDTLATPLLPTSISAALLSDGDAGTSMDVVARRAVVMCHENLHTRVVPTLNAIVSLLQALNQVDTWLLMRVYARVAYALLQPNLPSTPPFRTLRVPETVTTGIESLRISPEAAAAINDNIGGNEGKGTKPDEKDEKSMDDTKGGVATPSASKPSGRKPAGARILPLIDNKKNSNATTPTTAATAAATPKKSTGTPKTSDARSRVIGGKRLAPLSTSTATNRSSHHVVVSNTDVALDRCGVFMRLFVEGWRTYYQSWMKEQKKRRVGMITIDSLMASVANTPEPTVDAKEAKSVAAAAAIVAAASASSTPIPSSPSRPTTGRRPLSVITTSAGDAPGSPPARLTTVVTTAGNGNGNNGSTLAAPRLLSAPNSMSADSSSGPVMPFNDTERARHITQLFTMMSLHAQESLLNQLNAHLIAERLRLGTTLPPGSPSAGTADLELPATPIAMASVNGGNGFNFGMVNAANAGGFGTPVASRSRPTSASLRNTGSPTLAVTALPMNGGNGKNGGNNNNNVPLSPNAAPRQGLAPVRGRTGANGNSGLATPTSTEGRTLKSPPPRNSSIRKDGGNNAFAATHDMDGARSNSGTPPLRDRDRDHSPASAHHRLLDPLPPVVVGDRRPSRLGTASPLPLPPTLVAAATAAIRDSSADGREASTTGIGTPTSMNGRTPTAAAMDARHMAQQAAARRKKMDEQHDNDQ